MIRFTNHKGEKWGEFLDIKQFELNKIRPQRYDGKRILLSSVTDPYLPLEKKYQNTRKILEKLVGTDAEITILTKSKLVVRDIDLFKKFKNIEVGVSVSTMNEEFAKIIERAASKPSDRFAAVKEIHKNGIKTYIFVSPFFPIITDYKAIIDETIDYTDTYSFENLNFRPHNTPRIMRTIKEHYPNLLPKYKEIQKNRDYWDSLEEEIRGYCEKMKLKYKIEFHHGGFSKS
jgi:DNA repair photolyase